MKKCNICSKKIKLIYLDLHTCKCNKIFCIDHLHFDKHNCNYDYQTNFKKKIKENLPLVVFNKIDI